MASDEKSCQASAISSAGSPTITTGLAPWTVTTRTARPTSCGLTMRANQVGTYGSTPAPSPFADHGETKGELTDLVHQHDAHMAQMLELKRQLLIELVSLALGFQVPHGRFDEALSNLQSGLDLDPRRGARVQDRDAAGDERGKKIDRSNGEEKLGSDRPVIPKFLQHGSQVSRALTPCMRARELRAATGKMSSLFP